MRHRLHDAVARLLHRDGYTLSEIIRTIADIAAGANASAVLKKSARRALRRAVERLHDAADAMPLDRPPFILREAVPDAPTITTAQHDHQHRVAPASLDLAGRPLSVVLHEVAAVTALRSVEENLPDLKTLATALEKLATGGAATAAQMLKALEPRLGEVFYVVAESVAFGGTVLQEGDLLRGPATTRDFKVLHGGVYLDEQPIPVVCLGDFESPPEGTKLRFVEPRPGCSTYARVLPPRDGGRITLHDGGTITLRSGSPGARSRDAVRSPPVPVPKLLVSVEDLQVRVTAPVLAACLDHDRDGQPDPLLLNDLLARATDALFRRLGKTASWSYALDRAATPAEWPSLTAENMADVQSLRRLACSYAVGLLALDHPASFTLNAKLYFELLERELSLLAKE